MNKILNVVLVISFIQRFAAAQNFQSIQNAGPLNVDLSDSSNTGLQSAAETSIEEHKLGGYRPLYPPYFVRDPPAPSNYKDREYYSRGVAQQQQQQRQLGDGGFNRIEFAREILQPPPSPPSFFNKNSRVQNVQIHTYAFASSSSASASARNIRFPVT